MLELRRRHRGRLRRRHRGRLRLRGLVRATGGSENQNAEHDGQAQTPIEHRSNVSGILRRRRAQAPWMRRSGPYAAILVVSLATGAIVGHAAPPPGSTGGTASVSVWPVQPEVLKAAALPTLGVPEAGGRAQFAPGPLGSGRFLATGDTDEEAAARAVAEARSYVRALVIVQDRWIVDTKRSRVSPPRRERARDVLLRSAGRYMLTYEAPRASAPTGGGPLRGALIGLLVAGFGIAVTRRRTSASRDPRGVRGALPLHVRSLHRFVLPVVLVAAAAGTLVALTAAGPRQLYPLVAMGVLFAATTVYIRRAGEQGLRVVLVVIVAVSPLRGALLALANVIHLPQPLLTVNALQPCLIAAAALAALVHPRRLLTNTPRPLLIAWLVIAGAAAADLMTQTVGLNVYAVGLVQYLAYPTLAVVAWPILRRRDVERFAAALVGLGLVVACSIFLEAAHLVHFVEAVPPIDPITGTARYGGATGVTFTHRSSWAQWPQSPWALFSGGGRSVSAGLRRRPSSRSSPASSSPIAGADLRLRHLPSSCSSAFSMGVSGSGSRSRLRPRSLSPSQSGTSPAFIRKGWRHGWRRHSLSRATPRTRAAYTTCGMRSADSSTHPSDRSSSAKVSLPRATRGSWRDSSRSPRRVTS